MQKYTIAQFLQAKGVTPAQLKINNSNANIIRHRSPSVKWEQWEKEIITANMIMHSKTAAQIKHETLPHRTIVAIRSQMRCLRLKAGITNNLNQALYGTLRFKI